MDDREGSLIIHYKVVLGKYISCYEIMLKICCGDLKIYISISPHRFLQYFIPSLVHVYLYSSPVSQTDIYAHPIIFTKKVMPDVWMQNVK